MARRKKSKKNLFKYLYNAILIALICFVAYKNYIYPLLHPVDAPTVVVEVGDREEALTKIPEFDGTNYWIEVNNMKPFFNEEEKLDARISYIKLSELDYLGRVGPAQMSASRDTQPAENEKRGNISSIKPTGWIQKEYEYNGRKFTIMNRGHLLMWKLSALNAEPRNLATMTEYCNQIVMTKFEYYLTDYLKEYPNQHILYRTTPLFENDNLMAKGFLLEAYSIEDEGYGVEFCVFIYNVEPGITINYETGESWYAN